MKGNPENSLDWKKIAEADFLKSQEDIALGKSSYGLFWLQQASEKALKSRLIQTGWALQKTHDLMALTNQLQSKDFDLGFFEATAIRLTDLYFSERYVTADDDPAPDEKEVNQLSKDVLKLFKILFPEKTL